MMPDLPFYEQCFSQQGNAFGQGKKVYTEDVGGSSPSSPTIISNNLATIYEGCNRFSEPERTGFRLGSRR